MLKVLCLQILSSKYLQIEKFFIGMLNISENLFIRIYSGSQFIWTVRLEKLLQ